MNTKINNYLKTKAIPSLITNLRDLIRPHGLHTNHFERRDRGLSRSSSLPRRVRFYWNNNRDIHDWSSGVQRATRGTYLQSRTPQAGEEWVNRQAVMPRPGELAGGEWWRGIEARNSTYPRSLIDLRSDIFTVPTDGVGVPDSVERE